MDIVALMHNGVITFPPLSILVLYFIWKIDRRVARLETELRNILPNYGLTEKLRLMK